MITLQRIAVFACLIVLNIACNKGNDVALVQTDLLEHGIPLDVNIPANAKITKGSFGSVQEVYIQDSSSFFNIQIKAIPAGTSDVTVSKAEEMTYVRQDPYFSKLVQEDRDGFIYENNVDSTLISYHFKYCVLQGGKTFVFENSQSSSPSLEEAKFMYEAVKQ